MEKLSGTIFSAGKPVLVLADTSPAMIIQILYEWGWEKRAHSYFITPDGLVAYVQVWGEDMPTKCRWCLSEEAAERLGLIKQIYQLGETIN